MKSFARRLELLEADVGDLAGTNMQGTLEIHFTHAWPDCQEHHGQVWEQCCEHGPDCAKTVGRTKEPGRTVILRGPWAGV